MFTLNKRQFLASSVGNALEYYDATLYGFLAAFLGPLFFPSDDPLITTLASFGAFAAGFIVRPLGGILFGHFGDKYGRKKTLLLTLIMMVIPTFAISFLPSYQQIGFLAPCILVLCRLLQGLCVGGEYPGASIFIIEHSHPHRKGFAGGILTASGCFGAFMGALSSSFFTSSFFPDWGWRIPFFIGGTLGLIALYFRFYLRETPAFEKKLHRSPSSQTPIMQVFLKHPRNFICVFFIGSAAISPLYLLTIYLSSISFQTGLPLSKGIIVYSVFMAVCFIALPFMGWLADKIGRRRIMLTGVLGLFLLAYPVFSFVQDHTVERIIGAQIVLGLFNTAFVGPTPAFETSLFPVNIRYTAIAFGYGLGGALLGSTGPFLCTLFVEWTGKPEAPAFYLMLTSLLGFLGVILAKRPIEREQH